MFYNLNLRSVILPQLSVGNQVCLLLCNSKRNSRNEIRNFSENAKCPVSEAKQQNQSELKPFESIPGPRGYPIIGNLWRYLTGLFSFLMIVQKY